MYNKEAEFRTWLVEERMINPETISKEQNKKEFAKFTEDYNTGLYPTSFSFFILFLTVDGLQRLYPTKSIMI
jgi:hypothetical protein